MSNSIFKETRLQKSAYFTTEKNASKIIAEVEKIE